MKPVSFWSRRITFKNPQIIDYMEANVVVREKSNAVKNSKLKIVQFLITNGVFPDSIQFSNQELKFKYDDAIQKDEATWCNDLTDFFKGQINFSSKFPQPMM